MRINICISSLLVGLLATTAHALTPGTDVENFVLLDHRGEAHELHYPSNARAVVIMVQGNGCPIVRQVLPRLAEIRAEYEKQGVIFWLLNANLQDDRDSIAAEAEKFGIDFPILVDDTQLVAEALGVVRTAEVFVIDPQDDWQLKYRGPVDDRVHYERQLPAAKHHYLTDALDAVIAGQPVAAPQVKGVGCLVNLPNQHHSNVMPDSIGHPEPTVAGGPPIKSGVTKGSTSEVTMGGELSTVMPDSIGHPEPTVADGPPIKSGVTKGGAPSPVMPDLIGHPEPTVATGPPIKSGVTEEGVSGVTEGSTSGVTSYSTDIAPLLINKCIQCHRPNGIGPWAMTDYPQVKGFAPMIREVILTGRMPPWHADPHIGEWANDRSLSVEQKQMLVHWIEAGAPRGEGEDPLPKAMQQDWPDWPLGEPDAIVNIPGFKIPATGLIPYLHVVVDNPLDEPVWLRAVDFAPGAPEVVHHIVAAYTDEPPRNVLARGSYGTIFGMYASGAGPVLYPRDTAAPLQPDTKFILQLHYTTVGREMRDASRIGLYFHPSPPRHVHRTVVLDNRQLVIPPGDPRFAASARKTFDRDIVIYSLIPHAHYRGRSSAFRAIYPDGTEEVLLSVPKYDFNWQHIYELKTPKRLPAGTTVVHTTVYDNSEQNRANPDPDREVPWGLQSEDEMLFGVINYRYAQESAE